MMFHFGSSLESRSFSSLRFYTILRDLGLNGLSIAHRESLDAERDEFVKPVARALESSSIYGKGCQLPEEYDALFSTISDDKDIISAFFGVPRGFFIKKKKQIFDIYNQFLAVP